MREHFDLRIIKEKIADVRIVAATNEDMEKAIGEGRFREDLYHRLCEFEIRQPSLAECPEDIIPLAEFFRERFSKELKRETQGFTEDARRRMTAYRWPGNVRELQNKVRRAVLLAENGIVRVEDMGLEDAEPTSDAGHSLAIRDAADEKRRIVEALKRCGGNRTEAAKLLRIDRATLYRKMTKYGLNG